GPPSVKRSNHCRRQKFRARKSAVCVQIIRAPTRTLARVGWGKWCESRGWNRGRKSMEYRGVFPRLRYAGARYESWAIRCPLHPRGTNPCPRVESRLCKFLPHLYRAWFGEVARFFPRATFAEANRSRAFPPVEKNLRKRPW